MKDARTTDDGQTGTDHDLAIEAPERSFVDRPITIRITGASPGTTVEFEATMTDSDGDEWRSRATFAADATGTVDLSRHAPETGTYESARRMGWCWSMAAEDDQRVTALLDPEPKTVRLQASASDRSAERTITRAIHGDGVTRSDVETDDLVGTVYEPAGEGPHPGVLALHGSGGNPLDLTAALLARHGFAAVALKYFGPEDPISDGIERVPLPYFDAAASWLRSREGVVDGPLGIFGGSWGALAGLLLGARHDWVGAVVSYAGSGVVWDTPAAEPAWVDADGEPIPYVTGQGKPTLCEGQFDEADDERREAATIPVERIDGPVLLISGGRDPVWPARRLSGIAADRLRRHDHDYRFEHLTYDEAGHFVTPPFLPKRDPLFEGTPAGTAAADAAAWPTALAYLDAGIGGG